MNKLVILLSFIGFFVSFSFAGSSELEYGCQQQQPLVDDMPIIRSNTDVIDILDGEDFKTGSWILAPEYKPDVYSVWLYNGHPHRVTFYSDIDSISFLVEPGSTYDFIIQWGDKMCFQRLEAKIFKPAAVFDEQYIQENKGKINVAVPEVYELVNVVMAVTSWGQEHSNFIYQKSSYYNEVRNWFDSFSEHRCIQLFDSLLTENSGRYARLKMNGNAFAFGENGNIVRSPIYDRTGFRNDKENYLLPYITYLQSFADKSKFQEFYKEHQSVYDRQINFYRDSIDILGMQDWLKNNFPASNEFDSYNIIFSPLVSYNQSTTWFESNGFSELQPHVNFPYRQDLQTLFPISKLAEYIYRGNIVFTEINHGYLHSPTEKYSSRIRNAISNRQAWVDKEKSASGNYQGEGIFNEYMNWALISLRIVDVVPKEEQEKLISRVERSMVNGRGFVQFQEFNTYLVELYVNRDKGKTIADLYPQIVAWFEANNQ